MAVDRLRKFDIAVVCVTAAFLLLAAGYFLWTDRGDEPWQVETVRRDEPPAAQTAEQPEASQRPEKLLEGETIDINTASVLELQRLPGIGEARAQAIVDWREREGAFTAPEDLMLVPGIGEGILAQCRDYITVEG